jgi:site-specific recombinase XerD
MVASFRNLSAPDGSRTEHRQEAELMSGNGIVSDVWSPTDDPSQALGPAAPVSDQTRDYIAASKAPGTVRAYRSDLRHFEAWCASRAHQSLPAAPETVADYIAYLAQAGMKPATITRRLSAISEAHKMAQLESPTQTQLVRMTAAGIRRTLGMAQHQVRRIPEKDLVAMVAALPDDLRGLRDRAILLVGFVGGMRRSELVGLDVDDVVEETEGLRVTIRRSKTDQEGAGREVGLVRGRHALTDVVRAVAEWREAAGIREGPIFREVDRGDRVGSARLSDRAVARIVKGAAERVGIDPATVSGHSLRGGLATSAAKAGAPERMIMRTTGHKSEAMVRRYIEAGNLFDESASRFLREL